MNQQLPTEALSVIVPMYNEAGNAEPLVREIADALKQHPNFEIVVVDDGSSDSTLNELTEAQKTIPQLKIVKHKTNFGQSVGVVSGARAAQNPWIATLDGDGQNDPADLPNLAETAAKNMPTNHRLVVAGHRVNRKDTGWKRFGSKFANSIRIKFLNDDCPDTGCGIKLFHRDTFLTLPHFNHLHRYLPALFKRAGGTIINVPVNHRPRTCGSSKYGNWGRLKVGIADLIGVAWLIRRPCQPELDEHAS